MPLTRAELSLRAVTSPVGGVPRLSIAAESGPSTATSGIPASVTSRLLQASPLSVSTLWNLPGYREDDVHERSQDLVYETMLYHMDSDDRLNFINVPKPQGLPNELRDNLDDELITWIKDTYSRAYVAYMISQIEPRPGAPPETEPRVKLTADEKKKAWYFFRGKVSLRTLNDYFAIFGL